VVVDASGDVLTIEVGGLKPLQSRESTTGAMIPLVVPRSNGTKDPLAKIQAVAELSNGDWLVADEDERALYRFSPTGAFIGIFSPTRVSRLAVTPNDEVAGIDRDQRSIVLFDASGKITSRIPTKTTAYDVENAVDVAFDAFGHLYVLGRTTLAVFSPYRAGAPAAQGRTYSLMTAYTEPERNPGAFTRATALALDASGGVYLFDERAQRVRVYR
jgi:hypothetical protein